MFALSACGEPQEAVLPSDPPTMPLRSTDESGGTTSNAEMPEAALSEGGSVSEGDTPEMPSEGGDDEIDLVTDEPPGTSSAPAEPDEAGDEVPPDLGQSLPTIAEPGFPEGSTPRLVPLQFAGPITGRPVLFNVYLPPGYDSGSASYPVLYDLHGLTDSRDTNPGPVIRSFEAGMRNAVIGPLIVIFPQSFGEAYYADARDGVRPAETQLIFELIPYVDQNFRTLAHRARRGVSGFSMGGFGALAYATKYPERFSIGIGYDSALDTWQTLVGRRAYIATAVFGNDESYFDQISPWAQAERNAAVLTLASTLRIVSGTQYQAFNEAFRDHLVALGIPHEFAQTDCPHEYGCPIDREGARGWAIIQAEFSKPAIESAP